MFAVLKTGGKQYKVAKDDTLTVERLAANPGDKVQFNEVLMLGGDKVAIGTPMVDGAAVQAEVIDQIRGEKVINFKKRRRKHSSQRTKGHRQYLTMVKVTDILAAGADKSGVMAAVGTGIAGTAMLVAADAVAKPAAKKKAAPKTDDAKAKKKADAEAKAAADAKKAEDAAKKKAEAAEKEKAAKKKAEPAPKADDAAEAGDKPANLLTEAKGEPDDLKKISGVGPKLEGTLHEIGVFHFWQIAEWKKADIAYMDDRLSFKGRIERDEWIKQAKEFAKEAK